MAAVPARPVPPDDGEPGCVTGASKPASSPLTRSSVWVGASRVAVAFRQPFGGGVPEPVADRRGGQRRAGRRDDAAEARRLAGRAVAARRVERQGRGDRAERSRRCRRRRRGASGRCRRRRPARAPCGRRRRRAWRRPGRRPRRASGARSWRPSRPPSRRRSRRSRRRSPHGSRRAERRRRRGSRRPRRSRRPPHGPCGPVRRAARGKRRFGPGTIRWSGRLAPSPAGPQSLTQGRPPLDRSHAPVPPTRAESTQATAASAKMLPRHGQARLACINICS